MSDTVFVNGRAVIHAGSAGKSLAAFPDVCLCPPTPPAGPVPTPLVNNALASDLSGGASSVSADGNSIAKKSSYIGRSTGNEVARPTGGGVVTHVVQGKAYFNSYSMDVLVEGENVPRHLDLTTHNHASPPGNTPPWPWLALMAMGAPPPAPAVAPKFRVVEIAEVVTHNAVQKKRSPRGRQQYINVDPAVDPGKPHPEYGRCIQLKARLAQVAGPKTALAGQSIYWYYQPAAGNKAGLAGAEQEGFDAAGAGTKQKQVAVDAKGWTPVVSFYVSQYGGDSFRVFATEDPGYKKGRKTGQYAVWRQLWFEVDTMHARGGGLLEMRHDLLPAAFEPVFIRLLKQGKDNKPPNKWNIKTTDLHAFANDYFGAKRSPFQAHELAIDHQADPITPPGYTNLSLTSKTHTGLPTPYYRYDGGKTWLLAADYFHAGAWHPIPVANVSLRGKHKVNKRLHITLKGLPVAPSVASPVDVRYKALLSDEFEGDGASKPHAFVAMGYMRDTRSAGAAQRRAVLAMAHELGHLVGMVPATAANYVYLSGSHCTDSKCLMYYTGGSNRFCAICRDLLRRADLTTCKANFTHGKGPKA